MKSRYMLCLASCALLAGCIEASPVPLTPAAAQVEARKGDPPEGAKEVGPVEVEHGNGCGAFGERGSYEGALAMLRNRAAEMQADYVQIMTITEPFTQGNCAHNAFVIRGVAYRLGSGSTSTTPAIAPPTSAPPTSAPPTSAPPTSAPPTSAPPTSAPPTSAAPASTAPACTPPCSPGYGCENGVCVTQCNPACAENERCNADRVCESKAPNM